MSDSRCSCTRCPRCVAVIKDAVAREAKAPKARVRIGVLGKSR